MDIENYTFITGKIIQRAWGFEYRYTVQNQQGRKINSIVNLSGGKATDEEIAVLISNQLTKIDVIPEIMPDPIELAKDEKEEEIRQFLIVKDLISSDQSIYDIQSKDEIISEG